MNESAAPCTRREFCQRLPVVSTGILLGATTLTSGCAGATYIVPRGSGATLTARVADIPTAGALLQRPDMEHPVFVVRAEDGTYRALLARCTHRGCQPDPVAERLVCPCHGSEFDLDGRVLEGPAEEPLTRYQVTVEGPDLVVRMQGRDR